MKRLRAFLRLLAMSRLALAGATLVTTAFLADLILIVGEVLLFASHPYMGIVTYVVFPGVMALGLALIPLGIFLHVRRAHGRFSTEAVRQVLAGHRTDRRRALQVVAFLTLVNLVVFAFVGYRGFHYVESREFCGLVCHEVMSPEFETYSLSPHSEIDCVKCHVGPGVRYFVESKLAGARQLLGVLLDDYQRPIPTPIHNLRPARDVCEVCHRPELFHGNLIRVRERFEPDEGNTPVYTVLNMRVGGGGEHGQAAEGIHWHVSREHRLRYYASDPKRERIEWVEVDYPDGTRRTWKRPGFDLAAADLDAEHLRTMDCVDCHNRPTHIYLSPEQAIDWLMSRGRVDPAIPWIRKLGHEVLVPEYSTREEAMAGIASLSEVYRERHPEVWSEHREGIEVAIGHLQQMHRTFVHPRMKIRWNTYNSLIGHASEHTLACFRCHDGVLRDEEDRPITVACESCHHVLADREKSPLILKMLDKY